MPEASLPIVGADREVVEAGLVALDLSDDGGRATALQGAVSDSLAAADLHEPEPRPFWPHLTLARLRKGARWRPLEGRPDLAPFEAAAVTLYRSHLSRSGARYEALHRCPLRVSGRQPAAPP